MVKTQEKFVDKKRSEALLWVQRLNSGTMTELELAALQVWKEKPGHDQALSQASLLWTALAPAMQEVKHRARLAQSTSLHMTRRQVMGSGLTGALAAGLGYFIIRHGIVRSLPFAGGKPDYQTATGEQKKFDLSANLSIQLNTQTRMVPDDASGQKFTLHRGEANLRITDNGKPLIINAQNGTVSANNATFNLRQSDDKTCVTCLAGMVTVRFKSRSIDLLESQQLNYNEKKIDQPKAVNVTLVTAWQRGMLIFEDASVSDALSEINRYRHGQIFITNKNLSEKRVTAVFRLDHIEQSINYIEQTFGAKATRLPGNILLFV